MNRTNDALDRLGIDGFTYADLYDPARLAALSRVFHAEVATEDPDLRERFSAYAEGAELSATDESDLLVALAPHVGEFVARLFDVADEADALRRATTGLLPIFEFKKSFVRRRALKKYTPEHPPEVPPTYAERRAELVLAAVLGDGASLEDERAVGTAVTELLTLEASLKKPGEGVAAARARAREIAERLADPPKSGDAADAELAAVEALLADFEPFVYYRSLVARRDEHGYADWVSFRTPHPTDYTHLVKIERPLAALPEAIAGPEHDRRRRDGFGLTDPRMNRKQAMDEVDYCLYCHNREKDSCRHGFLEKDGAYKKNPLGIPLTGCPLDERISEMHELKRAGEAIGALAVVMVDNPMCPGTGHRICNDCMKSCIFQKQEPVNIPQIETRVLTDVLDLSYGVEIYGLLTRWNPLNIRQPHALPYNGKNVLVVGLGPAGYTLAHYLANEGFGVVGVDGLKIEPLDPAVVGSDGTTPRPVRSFRELATALDERVLAGFGGVSEYGITVRWDKNFLGLVRLTLERRSAVRFYGGVRFGGTLELDDAWAMGFDHVAIASGAGRPTIIPMKNNLIRGVRKASDFLMALQLTGAFKASSLANLQVRLPAVIVGGGLTAVDTATELLAYYVVQCEKYLERYESLAAEFGESGEERVAAMYDEEERVIMDEFLAHGRAVRAERERAEVEGEAPDFAPLVRSWGGVTIAYRKRLEDAPAYRLNHEEVAKALEEGIYFAECLDPREATADEYGALSSITFERQTPGENGRLGDSGERVTLPARALCVAAGTHPNTVYEREHPGTFERDKWDAFFTTHRAEVGDDGSVALHPDLGGVFTSYSENGRLVSFYGDNHPLYAGNVVKAMASAKKGYPQVVDAFSRSLAGLDPAKQAERDAALGDLFARLDDQLLAHVVRVERLTPTIIDVVVRAPLASRKFNPGQFYRLQNFEALSPVVDGVRLTMEGLALTGAWVDPEQGLLSLIVLEMGGSSRLCASLKPGEPVVVMGPTGAPTEIPMGETVLLAGGGLGNAVLFSIAKALRKHGNRVLYFAGYKNPHDVFKRDEIEEATDQVIWAADVGPAIEPRRPQDLSYVGNIVKAMISYATGELGEPLFEFRDVDRIIAIGSDRMMAAVAAARRDQLADFMKPGHQAVGSINSPMQCMMKEICAQCLQKHIDPATGVETVVFSCYNQDQSLDAVDFANLANRLKMNSVQEKLSNVWLSKALDRAGLESV